jgi:probable F420-dependent oxidoreductase
VQLGVVFPQTEIGADPGGVRAFAQAAEEIGYVHLLAYDHVLGADISRRSDWPGPYTSDHQFHELFVLFGYLAAVAPGLELVAGVLVLPQRQTALVAKQAAEVDLLTGGRFRLGVGVGWNAVEYAALGRDFRDRGRRMDEQITLLRRLWTEGTVSFRGDGVDVVGAGIRPLPVQRPIPVWVGGQSPAAYRRAGRLGDGWLPQVPPGPDFARARDTVRRAAEEAGRDPDRIGCEGRIAWRGDLAAAVAEAEGWRTARATHLGVTTMGAGLSTVDDHLVVLGRLAEELGTAQPTSAGAP